MIEGKLDHFKEIIFGIVTLVMSLAVFFYEDESTIAYNNSINHICSNITTISANNINKNNEGKVVYLQGFANTSSMLEDSLFGVKVKALKLMRVVEIYQWVENKYEENNLTKVAYDKEWSKNIINSGSFQEKANHQNPLSEKYPNLIFTAHKIDVGKFELGDGLVSKMESFEFYKIEAPEKVKNNKLNFTLDDGVYFDGNPLNPQIGDIRIGYQIIKPTQISAIGIQNFNTIEGPVRYKNYDVSIINSGNISLSDMLRSVVKYNNKSTMRWILCIIGIVLMWSGLNMLIIKSCVFIKRMRSYEENSKLISFSIALLFGIIINIYNLIQESFTVLASILISIILIFSFSKIYIQHKSSAISPKKQPSSEVINNPIIVDYDK